MALLIQGARECHHCGRRVEDMNGLLLPHSITGEPGGPPCPGAEKMRIAASQPGRPELGPYCRVCGWRKWGRDSWDGNSCKCKWVR